MCLATPMELTKIDGEWGYVRQGGREYKVSLSLISKPKVGDWILAHGELAINTVTKSEALDILKLVNSCAGHHH